MLALQDSWSLWNHSLDENDWGISGYKKICVFNTIEHFWGVFDNINIQTSMIFLMKNNSLPLWESPENIDGGSWSFMVDKEHMSNTFYLLSSGILCNQLMTNLDDMNFINGLSITPKFNSFIIKIWCSKYIENFHVSFLGGIRESMIFKPHKKNIVIHERHAKKNYKNSNFKKHTK
jgi:hypothetical protein